MHEARNAVVVTLLAAASVKLLSESNKRAGVASNPNFMALSAITMAGGLSAPTPGIKGAMPAALVPVLIAVGSKHTTAKTIGLVAGIGLLSRLLTIGLNQVWG